MAAVVAPRATGGERFSAGECAADAPNIVLEVSRRGDLTDVPARSSVPPLSSQELRKGGGDVVGEWK